MSSSTLQRHPFHLVDPSPWPFMASLGALTTTMGAVLWMHSYENGGFVFGLGFFSLLYVMFVWWRDVIKESTYEGHHTVAVQTGLRWGMILFIVSQPPISKNSSLIQNISNFNFKKPLNSSIHVEHHGMV